MTLPGVSVFILARGRSRVPHASSVRRSESSNASMASFRCWLSWSIARLTAATWPSPASGHRARSSWCQRRKLHWCWRQTRARKSSRGCLCRSGAIAPHCRGANSTIARTSIIRDLAKWGRKTTRKIAAGDRSDKSGFGMDEPGGARTGLQCWRGCFRLLIRIVNRRHRRKFKEGRQMASKEARERSRRKSRRLRKAGGK